MDSPQVIFTRALNEIRVGTPYSLLSFTIASQLRASLPGVCHWELRHRSEDWVFCLPLVPKLSCCSTLLIFSPLEKGGGSMTLEAVGVGVNLLFHLGRE